MAIPAAKSITVVPRWFVVEAISETPSIRDTDRHTTI